MGIAQTRWHCIFNPRTGCTCRYIAFGHSANIASGGCYICRYQKG